MNWELSSPICYVRHSSALWPPPGTKPIIKEKFISLIHDVMKKQLGSHGRYVAARYLWQAGYRVLYNISIEILCVSQGWQWVRYLKSRVRALKKSEPLNFGSKNAILCLSVCRAVYM